MEKHSLYATQLAKQLKPTVAYTNLQHIIGSRVWAKRTVKRRWERIPDATIDNLIFDHLVKEIPEGFKSSYVSGVRTLLKIMLTVEGEY